MPAARTSAGPLPYRSIRPRNTTHQAGAQDAPEDACFLRLLHVPARQGAALLLWGGSWCSGALLLGGRSTGRPAEPRGARLLAGHPAAATPASLPLLHPFLPPTPTTGARVRRLRGQRGADARGAGAGGVAGVRAVGWCSCLRARVCRRRHASRRSCRLPNRPHHAQIATVSADTAASFGITPRVAMLSYSTGTSGAGPQVGAWVLVVGWLRWRLPARLLGCCCWAVDPPLTPTLLPSSLPSSPPPPQVDKVSKATALVKEARPDLFVEGAPWLLPLLFHLPAPCLLLSQHACRSS